MSRIETQAPVPTSAVQAGRDRRCSAAATVCEFYLRRGVFTSFYSIETMPVQMLRVNSNVGEVLRYIDQRSKQGRFAIAMALTGIVRQVSQAMPAALEAELDRPTDFTKRGFYVVPAKRDKLVAAVGIKRKQAEYLQWQVRGGVRRPARKALKLPGDIPLTAAGNIRQGDLRRLVQQARSQRKGAVMYGKPANRPELPPGLYRRVQTGTQRRLQPLVLFPAMPARYQKRFDFAAIAERIVKREFTATLRRAWAVAQATAR